MNKNKVLKASAATLLLTMGAVQVAQTYPVTPIKVKATRNTKQTEKVQLINANTQWSYLDNNVDPGTPEDRFAWTKDTYDISGWDKAAGKFGAKNGKLDDVGGGCTPTVLLNQYINGDKNNGDVPAFFFRTEVNIENAEEVTELTANFKYDDAAIIYINGHKVAAYDEPDGGFTSNMEYGGSNDSSPKTVDMKLSKDDLKDVLHNGKNIVSVEIHQGRSSSSDVYFEMSDMQLLYGEEPVIQEDINLTVGSDETSMNLTWYANTDADGMVEVTEYKNLVNGEIPSNCKTIKALTNPSNDAGKRYYQATIKDLKENTKYAYRVINGDIASDIKTFETKDFDGSYNFIFAGDPQIGASGNAKSDAEGWSATLNDAKEKFNPNFLLSAGDQVNTASNESQYDGYLNQEIFSSMPQATSIGNHDSSSNSYNQHFNLPNESADLGDSTAGTDYWYVYNNTLFMDINSNNTSTAEHKAFMEDAIAKNKDVRWKVVVFHHSVYSTASHTTDGDIIQRRNELPPVFDELGIDVVLMGHDHVYTRTHVMKGQEVVTDTTNLKSVTDPDGIVYLTANSASGSKYYDIKTNMDFPFAAKMDQSKKRTISNVEVSDNEFKMSTYLYNDSSWELLDEFSVKKSPQVNSEDVVVSSDETSVKTEITAPAGSIEKDAQFQVQDIKEGTVYDYVKSQYKDKEFNIIDIALVKNNINILPTGDIKIKFDLLAGFDVNHLGVYKLSDTAKNYTLNKLSYTVDGSSIIVTTKDLGSFVLVNEKAATDDGNGTGNTGDTESGNQEGQDVNKPDTGTQTPQLPEVPQLSDNDKKPVNSENTQNVSSKDDVKTGVQMNVIPYAFMMVGALGSAVVLRKNKKESK